MPGTVPAGARPANVPAIPDDAARRARRARLRSEAFDVLVIGGGITGAGVALDAAARGLSVALVEQGDFASGTSSRSTKLVHGGLRYLPLGDLRQVREDLAERERLLRNAPHLVRPLPFVLPLYRGARRPLGVDLPEVLEPVAPFGIAAGLWAYDILAGRLAGRRHRALSAEDMRSLAPSMRLDGLRRAYIYHDAATDDARLVVAVVRTAQFRGAVVLNYARVIDVVRDGGRVGGARVVDGPSGEALTVSARTTVNAAGVWADAVAALVGPPPFHVRRAKGSHIVVRADRLALGRAAVVLPETDDGRIGFIVPWQGVALIGTTDTEWTGAPDAPVGDASDIAYLLDHAARFLAVPLRREDVVSVFAGLRPLVGPAGGGATAGLSRRHEIFFGPPGFVTITGGKLTTYRQMAEDTVNAICGERAGTPSPTRHLLLDGAAGFMRDLPVLRSRARRAGISGPRLRHLLHMYGARTARVLDLIDERPVLGAPIASDRYPHVAAEVVLAAREEMAVSVEDVLLRRTRLGHLLPDQGRGAARTVAAILADELAWRPGVEAAQVEAYRQVADRLAPPPAAPLRDADEAFAAAAAARAQRT